MVRSLRLFKEWGQVYGSGRWNDGGKGDEGMRFKEKRILLRRIEMKAVGRRGSWWVWR